MKLTQGFTSFVKSAAVPAEDSSSNVEQPQPTLKYGLTEAKGKLIEFSDSFSEREVESEKKRDESPKRKVQLILIRQEKKEKAIKDEQKSDKHKKSKDRRKSKSKKSKKSKKGKIGKKGKQGKKGKKSKKGKGSKQ